MASFRRLPVAFIAASILLVTSGWARTSIAGEVSLSHESAERAVGISGSAPVFSTVPDMFVMAGEAADQEVSATDADGQALTFYKAAGPTYMTVTTTTPGAGTGFGNINLAPPGSSGSATTNGSVGVTDGSFYVTKSFAITVTGTNVGPVLVQPSAMNPRAGETLDQGLSATDANGDALTFAKAGGPAFMSVTTTDPGSGLATGNIRLQPPVGGAQSATGTVSVTDGQVYDQKSFTITVRANSAPTFYSLYTMSLRAGNTDTQSLYAYDPDGDPITFSKVIGPPFMTVFTTSPGNGSAYGYVRLSPGVGDVGNSSGVIEASDGAIGARQTLYFYITPPDRPPVLAQPPDLTVTEGEFKEQAISATDADGDYISISRTSGQQFVTLSGYGGYGSTNYTLRLAPGPADVGTTTVTLQAYANGLTDMKSFQVTVNPGNFPASCGSSGFSTTTTLFGGNTIELQTADLNGDGFPDILVEMPDDRRAAVAMGNGDGTFGTPIELSAGNIPVSGVIGDFNRDGIPDVVVLDRDTGSLYLFPNDGVGGFGPRRTVPTLAGARSVATADVNKDGKLDLMISNPSGGQVMIVRGNGDGTFQTSTTTLIAGNGAWYLVAADLTHDGAPEILVVNPGDDDFTVFRNNGSGAFGNRVDYPVGFDPLGLTTGDFNGDGHPDVAVSNASSSSVTVYRGDGAGALSGRRDFVTGAGARQIVATDLNGDGKLDLATADLDSNQVSILLGDGAGAFGARSVVPVGTYPYGLASADFNDDLRTDIGVANYYDGSVTLLLNECAPRPDHPPVVHAPKNATGTEGSPITILMTVTDPDGPAIASITADTRGLPLGNNAALAPNDDKSGATFTWTPTFQDARALPYEVIFKASNVLEGTAKTKITVTNTNRTPVASAGGPYTGTVGIPVVFSAAGSTDPDGDALAYLWVFGDGETGVGATPSHPYFAKGTYGVALTVNDGLATGIATTTATVVDVLQARAFTAAGNKSIKLGAGKPEWCAFVEPLAGSFAVAEVDLTSLTLKSDGTGSVSSIQANGGKTSTGSDRDGNGAEEIGACFSKTDLRLLFSNLHGTSTVPVTIEARLYSGGIVRTSMNVSVSAGNGQLAATISPNPLNPDTRLTFATRIPGAVQVDLFDAGGRLVRRLLRESALPAGYHDLRIEARGEDGRDLVSGVYFFRIAAAEGSETGRLTVLK